MQRILAFLCININIGSNVMEGVGWKRIFVLSPCIGTSLVVPEAIGSGGAVTS